jgi:hypothetical protein
MNYNSNSVNFNFLPHKKTPFCKVYVAKALIIPIFFCQAAKMLQRLRKQRSANPHRVT